MNHVIKTGLTLRNDIFLKLHQVIYIKTNQKYKEKNKIIKCYQNCIMSSVASEASLHVTAKGDIIVT